MNALKTNTAETDLNMKMGNEDSSADKYMDMFKSINGLQCRDEKNMALVKLIGDIQQEASEHRVSDEFKRTLLGFYESEWDHQHLVCTALRRLGNKRRHDWSKDYAYLYILAGKFCFNITDEHFLTKWTEEVNRHYKLEPHHQKHTATGGIIHRLDIQEMALDQLSRSVYRNKGVIDEDNMRRYLPTFEGGDAQEKLACFQECVAKHTMLMKNVYDEYMREENCTGSKMRI